MLSTLSDLPHIFFRASVRAERVALARFVLDIFDFILTGGEFVACLGSLGAGIA